MNRVSAALRLGWTMVSSFGRTVLLFVAICWILASRFDWRELAVVASIGVVLLAIGVLFTVGNLDFTSTIGVEPTRVVVGDRAAGSLTLHNNRQRTARGIRVELPVGSASAVYSVPVLLPNDSVEELFVVPTNRRAIIPVGPVATIQGDPLGLLQRRRVWSDTEEIYVHPKTVPLSTIASGLIRDLEGQTTPHLSPSDIAFHTLRDYVPGDDRRHVHWKSSAKNGRLLVRQYVDTRRSHVAVLLSTDLNEYANDDEFELAVSCAASVALQAMRDEQTLSLFVGGGQFPVVNAKHLLDRFSGIEGQPGVGGIDTVLRFARRKAPDASVLVLCVGSVLGIPEIRLATNRIAIDTSSIVLRADPTSSSSFRVVGSGRFVSVPNLEVLSRGIERVLA